MKKHNKYNDSGVEWLGMVPEHWKLERVKNFLADTNSVSITGEEELLTVSHITGVTRRSEKNVNMFLAETNVGYKKCCSGDLIINTMWAWMGALGTCKDPGICSPAYNVYRPLPRIEYHAQYFDYLFRTPNFIVEMTRYSKGIVSSRLRLYPREFYQIQSIVPPIREQIAIANYLDSKTQLIDKKIELLNKKIDTYKEFRKSLINRVVCRGLDENVRLKDSGLDWIGKIPEHWVLVRVKDKLDIYTGNSISDKTLYENVTRGLPYVATKDIDIDHGNIDYNNGMLVPFSKLNDFKISHKNSSLICIEGASAGKKIGFNTQESCFVNKLCSIKSKGRYCIDKYIFYQLQSELWSTQFFAVLNGMIGGVSVNLLKSFHILMPSIKEQKEIVQYLDTQIANVDCIINNIQQQIEKLQELRKTLINDVVTGKIKVTE
jgi:type I restriction enzyme S subunit